MKIVISMNEMKASTELFKKLGLGTTELQYIAEMEEDVEVKLKDFVEQYDKEFAEYLNKDIYEVAKFNSIRKYTENGVTFFEVIIFEEFILDTLNLYSNFFSGMFSHLKGLAKAMLLFVKTDLKAFQSKWS